MPTKLNFARDVQGYNAEAPPFSTNTYSATLAAGTASSITIPGDVPVWYMTVKVQPTGWVWISRTAAASVPAGGTFAANSAEMAPGTLEFRRTVYMGDVISFLSPNTTADVEVSLFAVGYS